MKKTIRAASEPFNPEWIQSALTNLVKLVGKWIGTSHAYITDTAEDIANWAIAYALKPGLTEKGPFPGSKEHLFRTARKFAQYAFLDEVKKAKRIAASLDDREKDGDGDEIKTSRLEEQYTAENYRAYKQHKDMEEMGSMALRRLADFLRKYGVSHRDIEVYTDWELNNIPTEIVCKQHDIKPSNLHKIVCVINGILRRYGKELIKDV